MSEPRPVADGPHCPPDGLRAPHTHEPSRTRRVLVAGAGPATARLLARTLRRAGYAYVVPVAGGPSASLDAACAEHLPEVAVVDAGMPGAGAWQAAERLMALPGAGKGQSPRLILLCAEGGPVAESQARLLGATSVLSYPFRGEDLVRAVEAAHGGANPRPAGDATQA